MEQAQLWFDKGVNFVVEYGPKVLGAILIYLVGSWVVGRIVRGLRRVMKRLKYEESLQRFLMNLISWGLRIILILVVVSALGVDVTMFAAILAAAGLADEQVRQAVQEALRRGLVTPERLLQLTTTRGGRIKRLVDEALREWRQP